LVEPDVIRKGWEEGWRSGLAQMVDDAAHLAWSENFPACGPFAFGQPGLQFGTVKDPPPELAGSAGWFDVWK